jgi:hypothetical protein
MTEPKEKPIQVDDIKISGTASVSWPDEVTEKEDKESIHDNPDEG